MERYWSVISTPELKDLTVAQRRKVMRACRDKLLDDRRFWLGYAFLVLLGGTIALTRVLCWQGIISVRDDLAILLNMTFALWLYFLYPGFLRIQRPHWRVYLEENPPEPSPEP